MQDLNKQDETHIYSVKEIYSNKQHIRCLKIAPTDFFSYGIKELTYQLDQCIDLITLKIDLNAVQLDDSGLISISRVIDKFYKNIQTLTLEIERNGIGNEGMNILCETLKKCDSIKFLKLNLRINKINDNSFRNLTNALMQKKSLSYIIFDFRANNIGIGGLKFFIESTYLNKNIRVFQINTWIKETFKNTLIKNITKKQKRIYKRLVSTEIII
ncbi:kinase domain protein, putative (macronuclear) [Tetrahymena thermophila SB210]|uniref:Kinase domain protein, putative n=1 Tax=Tetrahymena thermophila (strain SB210) TaxID=312017 RepID=W7X760_TETTS|nr:kinase domain protein, putative [Tetrahymena thermophila SB210]EWS73197.1 kinase domain protein, putative [Tetrahymena thermophila SB210]|eukprot:XP_012654273.1 kinase domain protein, putative [Tetrahymena thermophila SB210]